MLLFLYFGDHVQFIYTKQLNDPFSFVNKYKKVRGKKRKKMGMERNMATSFIEREGQNTYSLSTGKFQRKFNDEINKTTREQSCLPLLDGFISILLSLR